jgi:hypothetical protein
MAGGLSALLAIPAHGEEWVRAGLAAQNAGPLTLWVERLGSGLLHLWDELGSIMDPNGSDKPSSSNDGQQPVPGNPDLGSIMDPNG